jgi:alkanesulfonate monooxygenase SsuD/methylene tetrahydromethanopterin reductase-like flavin-dependent oxidoreductase (luciferase family)
MARLDFAFWDALADEDGSATAETYEAHIRLAQRIEALGWSMYFTIEHQNAPQGVTAPTVYLTAVARETTHLRLGAMIWQLPFYHPLRLAQEVALLDQLSKGRVEFGTGIGVHEHEFIRWGVDFYQRAAMRNEVLDIVKMAWTQDEVTFAGQYFQFDEALPRPKPFQQPHPPIWAAVHSDSSFEEAARANYNVAKNLDTDDVVERKFDLYRRVWRESNHGGPRPRIFLMRSVHVAPTTRQAHDEARPYLGTGSGRFDGSPIARTRIGWGTHARGMGAESERPDNKTRGATIAEAARSYEFNIEQGLAIVGSPETVIREIELRRQRLGYDVLCTNHQIGRMPRELVASSVELFGKEVIPAFH